MFKLSRLVRTAFAAVSMLLVVPVQPGARAQTSDGTEVVRSVGEAMLALLADTRLSTSARFEELRRLYRSRFDHAAISEQIFGRAWRDALPAQKQVLAALLEEYLVKLLVTQVAEFADSRMEVHMSAPEPDGVVIASHFANARARKYLNVKWRLRKSGATFSVRDIAVESVSLTLHLRREFASEAARRDGSADALASALRESIAKLDHRAER